jgi:hypothetical protein
VGVTSFVARSGLGHDFVCHVGDLANFPFYHPDAYRAELELAAGWLHHDEQAIAFDVGAKDGGGAPAARGTCREPRDRRAAGSKPFP